MDETWAQRKAREIEAQSKVPEGAKPSFFSKFAGLVDSGVLKLPPSEFRILFALVRFADFDTGACHPSRKTLRALSGLSFHAIAAGLKGLVARGHIEKKRASKRLGFRNQYRVLCFSAGKVHQSKDVALVQERYTKAPGELTPPDPALVQVTYTKAPDPAFVHLSDHCFGAGNLHQKPLEPLKKEREEEESSSPPPSSNTGSAPPPQNQTHLGEDKGQDLKAVVDDVSNSISKFAERTPVSPFFERAHRKKIDAGEKAFKDQIEKLLTLDESK